MTKEGDKLVNQVPRLWARVTADPSLSPEQLVTEFGLDCKLFHLVGATFGELDSAGSWLLEVELAPALGEYKES